MAVRVITDSTCYIPAEQLDALGIRLVSLAVVYEGEVHRETDMDVPAFYDRLERGTAVPTSSQPPSEEILAAFAEAVEAGEDVLGVFLSSEMSGTYGSALVARRTVLDAHPDARIAVVDSRSNSLELGFAVLDGAEAARAGETLVACVEAVLGAMARSRFLFVPATLEYLRRGGRIGGASALIGGLLQIRPILTVVDGRTDVLARVRTQRRALDEMLSTFRADIERYGLKRVAVHHIHDPLAGAALAREAGAIAKTDVPSYLLGPVIGVHVGPGTVGVVYETCEPMREIGAEVLEGP